MGYYQLAMYRCQENEQKEEPPKVGGALDFTMSEMGAGAPQ